MTGVPLAPISSWQVFWLCELALAISYIFSFCRVIDKLPLLGVMTTHVGHWKLLWLQPPVQGNRRRVRTDAGTDEIPSCGLDDTWPFRGPMQGILTLYSLIELLKGCHWMSLRHVMLLPCMVLRQPEERHVWSFQPRFATRCPRMLKYKYQSRKCTPT